MEKLKTREWECAIASVAATAYAHNLVLVTFNAADFSAFNDVKVVDWRT